MSAIADAILDDLTPEQLAALAKLLRPFLDLDRQSSEALLTPAAAAARLSVHPKTLTRAAKAGRVPGAERVGRSWRFRAEGLRLDVPAVITTTAAAPLAQPRKRAGTSAADAIRGLRS